MPSSVVAVLALICIPLKALTTLRSEKNRFVKQLEELRWDAASGEGIQG